MSLISRQKKVVLETMYISILLILLLLVVSTPYLIRNNFSLFERIVVREEFFEGGLISFLLLLTYVILRLYKKEAEKHLHQIQQLKSTKSKLEDNLTETFKYIGQVNVQIQEIKSIFSELKSYPRSKSDFKNILIFLARKSLNIVRADWVIIRFINSNNLNTLHEHTETRGKPERLSYRISNKDLVGRKSIDNCTIIGSDQENLSMKAFCVFCVEKLTEDQQVMIKAILNQLEMLFIIFTSQYYKESYLKKAGRKSVAQG